MTEVVNAVDRGLGRRSSGIIDGRECSATKEKSVRVVESGVLLVKADYLPQVVQAQGFRYRRPGNESVVSLPALNRNPSSLLAVAKNPVTCPCR